MIYRDLNLFSPNDVKRYFEEFYPQTCEKLSEFRLMDAKSIQEIGAIIKPYQQITLHAFPGLQISGNAYMFPRFLRLSLSENGKFQVTREKSTRERLPSIIDLNDIVEYYFELAESSFLNAEMELNWIKKFPPFISRSWGR